MRPTDPIPVLFCATDGSPTDLGTLQQVLHEHAADEHGVIVGPIANTDPDLLGVVADRYVGFQLLRLPADGQEWADDERIGDWVAAMRANHAWPNVTDVTNDFLAADSLTDARAVFDREPVLSDPVWEPVIRWIGARTASAQDTSEQLTAVAHRMRLLARWRLGGRTLDPETLTAQRAFNLLEHVTSLQSAAARTQDDVRRGIDLGRELIELSSTSYGPGHPLTLTALNDTAALMLDDADAPETMTAQARTLLQQVRATAIGTRSAALADATMNLGLAQLRRDRIVDADVTEAAICLLQDALHLQQLFYPEEPERAVSALSNLGALTRSRLTGDPAGNLTEAIRLLRRVKDLTAGPRQLTLPDRLTVETNLLSTLSDRAAQDPSDEQDQELLDGIDLLDAQLAELSPEHPARIRAYTNLGSIAVGLLYRGGPTLPADLPERAGGWLSQAHQHTRGLPVDDATRVLATSSLAALLFRLGGEDNLRRARDLVTECATALADSQSTRLHHTFFDNLARLHLAEGEWDAAIDVLELACRHADIVIARAASAATRLAQVAAAGDLYQRLALLYTHRRNARSAIHTVERSRARWRSAGDGGFDPEALDRAVAARLREGTALLYTGTCGLGSYAVLLVGGRGAGAWTTKTTTADLAPLLTALQAARTSDDVAAVLDAAAAHLADGLLDQARTILRSAGVTRVSIVASGALAGLPVGALPGPDGALDEHATVEYLIGARPTRAEADTPVPTDAPSDAQTVAIVDPTNDLPFAASELAAVRRYAPEVRSPAESVGVRGWLLARLPEVTHLHLACHARYDPRDPFASQLVLGEGLALTVADLAAVATPRLGMVVASCCQTGVVDQRGADELIGLAQTLIAAGAVSAVAALWEIDDAATSLLIAKFYDELAAGTPPADALAQAQRSLRIATMSGLLALAQPNNDRSWVPEDLRRHLRALALHPRFRSPDSRPFAHPAHWAGLLYIGP